MRKLLALVILLAAFCGYGHAQASPGYTKLNAAPVTALTYTDTTVLRDAGLNYYQYQVIAVCPSVCGVNALGQPIAGQSGPVTTNLLQEPGSGTGAPSITLTWVASTTSGVTYDIYRIQGVPPNAAGAVTTTVN